MKIRTDYDCDAVLNGAVTCAEIYAVRYADSFPQAGRRYVSDDYIAHLRDMEISYLFAGKTILQAGMMDELSLVVAPLTDGATNIAAVFDRSRYIEKNTPVAFSLIDIEKLPGNGIWLKYKPQNVKKNGSR